MDETHSGSTSQEENASQLNETSNLQLPYTVIHAHSTAKIKRRKIKIILEENSIVGKSTSHKS